MTSCYPHCTADRNRTTENAVAADCCSGHRQTANWAERRCCLPLCVETPACRRCCRSTAIPHCCHHTAAAEYISTDVESSWSWCSFRCVGKYRHCCHLSCCFDTSLRQQRPAREPMADFARALLLHHQPCRTRLQIDVRL